MHNIGIFVGHGAGIKLYQAGDTLITRNEIAESPRYAIAYNGKRFCELPKMMYGQAVTFSNHFDFLHTRNIRVIGNEIYSTCRNSHSRSHRKLGTGPRQPVAGNAIHDVDCAVGWDGWLNIFFLDDDNHFLTMRDNILTHCQGGTHTDGTIVKTSTRRSRITRSWIVG